MILIADSGSSKTHWKLKSNDQILDFYTLGINPFFVNESFVHNQLNTCGLEVYKREVQKIIFYGSGCSSDDRKLFISSVLSSFFPSATTITVDHDMVAACLALFGNKKGIACIIGTGSNSCVWDGENITSNVPALGYILGDEASGSYIGKEILKHYIYQTLPPKIHNFIKTEYNLDKEDVFNAVYKGELPNRFLASFSRVASEFPHEEMIESIVRRGFFEFVTYHIACYPEARTYSIGCVGSIASVFEKIFREELEKFDLRLDILLKDPIDNLLDYHLKN